MVAPRVDIPEAKIADFCRRWKISELSLFGSVLRDDFDAGSDVDVLVTFGRDASPSAANLSDIAQELADLFGRRVDVLTHRSVEEHHNPWLRRAILGSAKKLYSAA